jgi:hypothetical protein
VGGTLLPGWRAPRRLNIYLFGLDKGPDNMLGAKLVRNRCHAFNNVMVGVVVSFPPVSPQCQKLVVRLRFVARVRSAQVYFVIGNDC